MSITASGVARVSLSEEPTQVTGLGSMIHHPVEYMAVSPSTAGIDHLSRQHALAWLG